MKKLNPLLNFIMNLRFKQKLILSYLLVVIIPMSVLGAYSYYQSKSLLIKQAKIGIESNVKKMADTLDYKVKMYNAAIESISYNSNIVNVFHNEYSDYYTMYKDLEEKVVPLFNTIQFLNNDIRQVTVYTDNDMTERRNSILSAKHIEHAPWFKETMTSVQTNWFSEDGKLFAARRFVGTYRQDIRNLLYVEVDSKKVFADLAIAGDKQYGIMITDQNRNILYENAEFEDQDTEERIRRWIGEGNEVSDWPGLIAITCEIAEPGWNIVYYIPSDSVSVNAGIILKATITIEGVCLLLVMILIWALSYSFVKRIQQLNRTMHMAAIGNLEIDVRSDSKDEIGELTNRFGKMLKSFKAMIDEVYRSKIIQQEAEMKALQSQINPHFLYNSLSLINWKAIDIHADEISRITTTLSLFYRTTLNRGEDIISVQGELDNTRAYIDIQLVMHEYGFDVAYDIEESLYAYDVIKLILQPVVENAIEHGIDQKRGGRGLLTIKGAEEEETIVFTVEDNGPGMTGQQLEEVFVKKTHGYGLFNVQQRIQIFFGTQYGISAYSEPEQGTRITIVLPKYNKNKG